MAKIQALTFSRIIASSVSDDGKHALFKAALAGGDEINLSVPSSELMNLMSLASSASGQAQRILQNDPNMKYVFPTDWWDIRTLGNQVVMSFRMPGGMELSFQIHRDAAARYRETLDAILGQLPTVPPGVAKH